MGGVKVGDPMSEANKRRGRLHFTVQGLKRRAAQAQLATQVGGIIDLAFKVQLDAIRAAIGVAGWGSKAGGKILQGTKKVLAPPSGGAGAGIGIATRFSRWVTGADSKDLQALGSAIGKEIAKHLGKGRGRR